MPRIDFTGVESAKGAGFDLIPVGRYVVRITKAECKTFNSGTEGINVDLEIQSGDYKGRKLWDTLYLTKKALPMTRAKIEAAGIKVADREMEFNERMLVGKVVEVTVKHEPDYNDPDKLRARVQFWDPAQGSGDFGVSVEDIEGVFDATPTGAADDSDGIPF